MTGEKKMISAWGLSRPKMAGKRQAPALRYLEPQGRIQPANAAVALIVDAHGHYLVQLRDSKPTIFFPDHWGCFGGAIESGGAQEGCVSRELDEDLGLHLSRFAVRHFTTFTFDFGFAKGPMIYRAFYEVSMT